MSVEERSYFIDGKKLFLRELRDSDAEGNYYFWMNDYSITQYTESRFHPYSVEQLKEYIHYMNNNHDNLFLAIIHKDSGTHIGNIKMGPINWMHRIAEIGIIIGEKQYWGKGFGSEAISLLSRYAFTVLNMHKLWATCLELNLGAIKAFKKAGFSEEGIHKKQYFFDGKYIDDIFLGLLNNNFS